MPKKKKDKQSPLRAIYTYMVCIISFTAIISSGIGFITGLSNNHFNKVDLKQNPRYNMLDHSIGTCIHQDQFEECIEDQIEKENRDHQKNIERFSSDTNEQLAITIPMFFISLIIFFFHWKNIKNQ
jgi:hypothetical protein